MQARIEIKKIRPFGWYWELPISSLEGITDQILYPTRRKGINAALRAKHLMAAAEIKED